MTTSPIDAVTIPRRSIPLAQPSAMMWMAAVKVDEEYPNWSELTLTIDLGGFQLTASIHVLTSSVGPLRPPTMRKFRMFTTPDGDLGIDEIYIGAVNNPHGDDWARCW